jgi:hypothetical protein
VIFYKPQALHGLFFLAHLLIFENGFGPLLFGPMLEFVRTEKYFGPLFLTFGPLLFSKPGQRKRGNTNVCGHRGPLSHFFLLLNVI